MRYDRIRLLLLFLFDADFLLLSLYPHPLLSLSRNCEILALEFPSPLCPTRSDIAPLSESATPHADLYRARQSGHLDQPVTISPG